MYIMKDPEFAEILNQWDQNVDPQWRSIDCGYGWATILLDCHRKLVSIDPEYKVVQIKEKFGTLRYYFDASKREYSRDMQDIAFSYERESQHVCEVCGEKGELRNRKNTSLFVKTVCDTHFSDR